MQMAASWRRKWLMFIKGSSLRQGRLIVPTLAQGESTADFQICFARRPPEDIGMLRRFSGINFLHRNVE